MKSLNSLRQRDYAHHPKREATVCPSNPALKLHKKGAGKVKKFHDVQNSKFLP